MSGKRWTIYEWYGKSSHQKRTSYKMQMRGPKTKNLEKSLDKMFTGLDTKFDKSIGRKS